MIAQHSTNNAFCTPSPSAARGVSAGGDGGALDYERRISATLINEAKVRDVLIGDRITPDWFTDSQCRETVRTVLDIVKAGKPVDPLAICKAVGFDPDTVAELWMNTVPAYVPSYMAEIRRAYEWRMLTEAVTSRDTGAVRDALGMIDAEADTLDGPELIPSAVAAYKPDARDTIAGDGWLRRGALSLLTGGTGLGKSVLVMQTAVSVSGGTNILGAVEVRQPFRVLLAQAENDIETIQRDLLSCCENLGVRPDALDGALILRRPAHRGLAFIDWLGRETRRTCPDLVVVDNYQSFVGAIDINATAGCLEFLGGMQRVIDSHKTAMLLVAHTPKPRERDGWNLRENVYLAAGTSALANWCRTSCELTVCGKETERFRLTFSKNGERAGLRGDDGRVCRELFLQHSADPSRPFWDIAEDQSMPSRSEYAEKVRRMVADNPTVTLAAIMQATGCAKTSASRLRKEALDAA